MYGTCQIDICQYFYNSEFISGFFSWQFVKLVFLPPVLAQNGVKRPQSDPKLSKFSIVFLPRKTWPIPIFMSTNQFLVIGTLLGTFWGHFGVFPGDYDVITAWNFNFSTFWRYYCLYYSSTLPALAFRTKGSLLGDQWPIRYIVGVFWGYSPGIMTS